MGGGSGGEVHFATYNVKKTEKFANILAHPWNGRKKVKKLSIYKLIVNAVKFLFESGVCAQGDDMF